MRTHLASNEKLKISIYKGSYKGIPIKSDKRVHDEVMRILPDNIKNIAAPKILDVASGKGALSQRLIDEHPNVVLDCNDLEAGILADGARAIYSKNLNENFDFQTKYDCILAIEVIEHLENPFHFIRTLKKHLNPSGKIILSTPNIDSLFDRIHYLIHGYPYYFGERGIVNSGGHITMCPEWLLRHIAISENLNFEPVSNSVNTEIFIGWKARSLLTLLYPLKTLMRNLNNRSSTICVLSFINEND